MAGDCIRTAWLTLGAQTQPLEDWDAGYFCTALNLGYPEVRDVTNNRPDQHGIDDQTMFYGKRVVTADIVADAAAGARIDEVMSDFAPFMHIDNKPVLHYVLDRPGAAERTLTLRATDYAASIAGADTREIHLSWIATDPFPLDATVQTGTAWAAGVLAGRGYNLTFPRTYPTTSGGPGTTTYNIHNSGDVPVYPILRVYGPITGARVQLHNNDGSGDGAVKFIASYIINSGAFVEVDMAKRVAYLNGNRQTPVLTAVDWLNSSWLGINPYVPGTGANVCVMSMTGSSVSAITQVQAIWQDAYLT
jgi:uncharacterized protein (DUF433 family)